MRAALSKLVDQLFTGHPAAPAAPYAASHMPTSMALLQHLASLLDIGDGAAVDVVEQSAVALTQALGESLPKPTLSFGA